MCAMFHAPSGKLLVTGGNFTTITGNVYHGPVNQMKDSEEGAMKRLYEYVASGAIHNSGERFDAPKCHPETRVEILDRLMMWTGAKDLDELMLWLFGAAGAGKSAIMQTVALQLEEENRLTASFFFSRTGSKGRNDHTRFAATLAYQICKSVPEAKPLILEAIVSDPGLFELPLPAQLGLLVVKPLLSIPSKPDSTTLPRVILVDGLDECINPQTQTLIIQALCSASVELKSSPIPHKIIIASRPEYEIKTTLGHISNLQKLHLNKEWKPSEDIRRFLDSSFEEIKTTHPLGAHFSKYWPSSIQYDQMVDNSSEHFVYSSTLIQYVKCPRHDPRKRLERILMPTANNDSHGDNPFVDLDNLYLQVLRSVDPDHISTVLHVLRMALIGSIDSSWQLILPSKTIQLFLELPDGELELAFMDLGSVLEIYNTTDEKTIHEPSTRLLHASFLDFLMDKRRSKEFWIDDPEILKKMMQRCADLLWKDRNIYIFEHWNLCILCLPHFYNHLNDTTAIKEMICTIEVPSMMEFIIEYRRFPSFTPFRMRPFFEWAIKMSPPTKPEVPPQVPVLEQLTSVISSALGFKSVPDTAPPSPFLVALKSWVLQTLSQVPFTTKEADQLVEDSMRVEYLEKLRKGWFPKPPVIADEDVVDYAVDLLVVMRKYRHQIRSVHNSD